MEGLAKKKALKNVFKEGIAVQRQWSVWKQILKFGPWQQNTAQLANIV